MIPEHFITPINRGGITVTGPDAEAFLQGLITNDINLLGTEPVLYAALLTPQGKFLHDFFIYPVPGGFLLETEAEARRDDLIARLTAYRLRAKVTIAAVDISVIVGRGPAPTFSSNATIVTDPRHPGLGWRVVQAGEAPIPSPGGFTISPLSVYDQHRIALCVPDGSRDAEIGVSTPEELNLPRLNAISFTKGCYVGQELTARMEYRGLAKRHLYPMALKSVIPAQAGIPSSHANDIYMNGRLVGTLRSHSTDMALALLKDDAVSDLEINSLELVHDGKNWILED